MKRIRTRNRIWIIDLRVCADWASFFVIMEAIYA
jgi:hypothetical protein